MRGVVFKNLGQKFSSIIHAANLDCDGVSASYAPASLASGDGAGRKTSSELPPAGMCGTPRDNAISHLTSPACLGE